ncbi:MAG: hypothetical protein AB9835_13495 [Eubacteriales bacterium]
MKRYFIVLLAFLLCLVLTVSMVFAGESGSASPGSADDPLVTLSYVKQVLQPQIEASLINKLSGTGMTTPTSPTGGGAEFKVVELKNGQILRPVGSLEVVLRSDSASVISPFPSQGLSDLTAGGELLGGTVIPINHLLLIPRADGRAVKATSELVFIMVRGEYTIEG